MEENIMANFYKVAAKATAKLFDGSQAGASALVLAYPDVISIQQEDTYPELAGQVTIDPAETGVVATVDIVKADAFHPYIITIEVTEGASDGGDVMTIKFFKEDPIVVAVTLGDDALTVAAAIAGETFPGFTAVDNLDGTITITQDALDNVILTVLKEDGSIQNAYADNYIAFVTEMDSSVEVSKTQVWSKTSFEKYFIAEPEIFQPEIVE